MESAFCDDVPEDLKVIETIRWDRRQGFARLNRHMRRCTEACRHFRIPFNSIAIEDALRRAATGDVMRIRLTLDLRGRIEVSAVDIVGQPVPSSWRIGLSAQRLNSADPWLRVKTTRRRIYDQARQNLPEDLDELIFANEKDEICEGTITNLFFDFGGGLLTPPLSSGLLPGVLRDEMLDIGKCREAVISAKEISDAKAIWAGNSLRGLIPCQLQNDVAG